VFFFNCKENAREKLVKMGHGPHSSTLVVICFVLCIVFVCKCLLPPANNPSAVYKYIIPYLINAELLNVKSGGTYTNHSSLMD
jgi:hypothetical protein